MKQNPKYQYYTSLFKYLMRECPVSSAIKTPETFQANRRFSVGLLTNRSKNAFCQVLRQWTGRLLRFSQLLRHLNHPASVQPVVFAEVSYCFIFYRSVGMFSSVGRFSDVSGSFSFISLFFMTSLLTNFR